jgi:hypothetical protein
MSSFQVMVQGIFLREKLPVAIAVKKNFQNPYHTFFLAQNTIKVKSKKGA